MQTWAASIALPDTGRRHRRSRRRMAVGFEPAASGRALALACRRCPIGARLHTGVATSSRRVLREPGGTIPGTDESNRSVLAACARLGLRDRPTVRAAQDENPAPARLVARGKHRHRGSPMLLRRNERISTTAPGAAPARSKEQWHAICVVGCAAACPAALKLHGRRFLSNDAPRLPLPECSSAARCTCIYRHFPDRRAAPRRASERNGLMRFWIKAERRTTRGRRADDAADL